MFNEMDANTTECLSGDEVLAKYLALCQPHGQIDSIWLFCHEDHPAETLCMLEMSNGAKNAAAALGGWASGTTACVRHPIPAAFRCRFRHDGKIFVRSCDECRLPKTGTEEGQGLDLIRALRGGG